VIRIDRGSEPDGLGRAGPNRLKKAVAAYELQGAPSKELAETLDGYNTKATKTKLWLAQKKKCAWCERTTDRSSHPVEHYRPKNGAWRHLPKEKPEVVEHEYYWWLTWAWSNLLFSCVRCNDQGHKANYFPLAAGSSPLVVPARPLPRPIPAPSSFDVSTERPLLLNPLDRTIDPLDHLRWKPVDCHWPRDAWIWSPEGLSDEGKATIRILRLEELGDDVGEHIKKCVLRPIVEIEKHLNATPKRLSDARERWDTLLLDTLSPESTLSAAAWCAIDILMPARNRSTHGLKAPPRPGS